MFQVGLARVIAMGKQIDQNFVTQDLLFGVGATATDGDVVSVRYSVFPLSGCKLGEVSLPVMMHSVMLCFMIWMTDVCLLAAHMLVVKQYINTCCLHCRQVNLSATWAVQSDCSQFCYPAAGYICCLMSLVQASKSSK
jgi:hypothetical protein